jgi:hypothetical protein
VTESASGRTPASAAETGLPAGPPVSAAGLISGTPAAGTSTGTAQDAAGALATTAFQRALAPAPGYEPASTYDDANASAASSTSNGMPLELGG